MQSHLGALVLVTSLLAGRARADHGGMAMGADAAAPASLEASVSLLAASFSAMYYEGDYMGVRPAVGWQDRRWAVGASLPFYRLKANGLQQDGVGDLMVDGQLTVLARPGFEAGAMVGVSAATGNSLNGFGMGHPMVMPALWGAWHDERWMVTASAGYSRAIVDASSHHDHGLWPLVDPMNMSEITWSGGGELMLGHGVSGGGRLYGGVPVGALPGHDRIIGALRLAFASGRLDTSAELETGLDGDPFTLRGVVQTAFRF